MAGGDEVTGLGDEANGLTPDLAQGGIDPDRAAADMSAAEQN